MIIYYLYVEHFTSLLVVSYNVDSEWRIFSRICSLITIHVNVIFRYSDDTSNTNFILNTIPSSQSSIWSCFNRSATMKLLLLWLSTSFPHTIHVIYHKFIEKQAKYFVFQCDITRKAGDREKFDAWFIKNNGN